MKYVLTIAVLGLLSLSAQAADIRHVRCFADWDKTLVYEGNYLLSEKTEPGPTKARHLDAIVDGRCVLGSEIELPSCVSMVASVYLTPICN